MNSQPFVLPVWPAGAPGSEDWTQQEQQRPSGPPFNVEIVRNVTHPTLTVYLPDPAIATGTAMVVCPGGAFHMLAVDHEGVQVARWLNERGVAAFVLKYRVARTPERDEDFAAEMHVPQGRTPVEQQAFDDAMKRVIPLSLADAQQAMRLVRQHADQWGIARDRQGIMGFSAGGRVTSDVTLANEASSRPNFAAPIYAGAIWEEVTAPEDAPPLFLAFAQNDLIAVDPGQWLYSAWRKAGRSVELHIYADGGHGFGMNKQGLPCDSWIDRLGEWMGMLGLLKK